MLKSKIAAVLLAMSMSMGITAVPVCNVLTINASADNSKETTKSKSDTKNGWYSSKSNGKKMYYADGKKVVSKTKKIDGKIYLFDENGYLVTDGMHTVNNNKYYSNKDGTVKCNQWVSHKYKKSGNTYYYAASTGKITEYKFKKQSDSSIYLYVNGKKSKAEDIPSQGTFKVSDLIDTSEYDESFAKMLDNDIEVRTGYFKVGSHFYHLDYSSTDECVVCDQIKVPINESYNCPDNALYDLGSGKKLGSVLGVIAHNDKGYISDGVFFNTKEKNAYFISNDKVTKERVASPIIITSFSEKLNSVGGLNVDLTFANNSGKTINYVYYTVHVINRVGDTVKDEISDKTSFLLKDTGPYAADSTPMGTWEAIMYNNSAYETIIDEIEIIYSDGTSDIMDKSQITALYTG